MRQEPGGIILDVAATAPGGTRAQIAGRVATDGGDSDLRISGVSDAAIAAEIAPCFVGDGADDPARTDTVVLACTHYPLLLERLTRLAPWPVDWIDPAPAIARRVADLLGPAGGESDEAGAEMIFTSNRPHALTAALTPFFGGRVPA